MINKDDSNTLSNQEPSVFESLEFYCSIIQSNVNSSNPDASFTMANLNSFLSSYEILPIAQEEKAFRKIFLFYQEIVCCLYLLELPHRGNSNEYTQHTIMV